MKSLAEKKGRVLTGDRPTGKLHLGHFVGSIENRLSLQKNAPLAHGGGASDELFYMVADVQALTDNATDPAKVRAAVLDVALDNLACGMDPKKTLMFIQSQVMILKILLIFVIILVRMLLKHFVLTGATALGLIASLTTFLILN